MSARLGTCKICGKDDGGVYSCQIYRGWVGDKHDIDFDVCEGCIDAFVEGVDALTKSTNNSKETRQ